MDDRIIESVDNEETMAFVFGETVAMSSERDSGVYNSPQSAETVEETVAPPAVEEEE